MGIVQNTVPSDVSLHNTGRDGKGEAQESPGQALQPAMPMETVNDPDVHAGKAGRMDTNARDAWKAFLKIKQARGSGLDESAQRNIVKKTEYYAR